MTGDWFQICPFNYEGQGIDAMTECSMEYNSSKEAKEAAQKILRQYAEIERVWVRKINHGHMRTVVMMEREITQGVNQ